MAALRVVRASLPNACRTWEVEVSRLGAVLARSQVPLFIVNACRSAVGEEKTSDSSGMGSVAQGLLQSGARGVVAMSASVRVISAVEFFDRFYAELSGGQSIVRACHRARRAVETKEGVGPIDWAIPVPYLREDFTPFEGDKAQTHGVLDILKGEKSSLAAKRRLSDLFIGRDGDLYKVDRAIDEHQRVLVYGVGGIGNEPVPHSKEGGSDSCPIFQPHRSPV